MSRKASSWEGESLKALQQRWDRADVHLYSHVDSTNARAHELAADGAPAGTIVLAEEQTAGRGVESRRWDSPRGAGLYLSLVLRPPELASPLLVPLLAGLGAARAIDRLVGASVVAVKWPNDLIAADRKVGGVLSEASWTGATPNFLIVGIGVNVHQKAKEFPPPLRDVAVSLDTVVGRTVSRLELADRIIREVEDRCVDPPVSLNRETLREFDDYDWLRDRRCRVVTANGETREGTAVGIAPDGALLFRPDRGALARVTMGRVRVAELPTPEF